MDSVVFLSVSISQKTAISQKRETQKESSTERDRNREQWNEDITSSAERGDSLFIKEEKRLLLE